MKTRRLGRTNLQVSEVGFGAWGIGGTLWIGARDDESRRALHRALDLGLNLIDTALVYGQGHSERLVGQVLRERGGQGVYVASKIPPRNGAWPATAGTPVGDVFPPDHLERSTEESLRHLGLEAIDLMQLHVWHDSFLDQDGWQEGFRRLKQAGKVRFLGVSVTEHDCDTGLRAVASGLFDAVQVLYNVFDQRPAERFLPACLAHDVGVLARVPLDEGGLTGTITPDSSFPEGDFRERYFRGERKREVFERCQALSRLLGAEARTLPELALRFCLGHEAVATVIPGMRRVATVEQSCAVGDGRRLSPQLLEQLRQHAWPRNFWS